MNIDDPDSLLDMTSKIEEQMGRTYIFPFFSWPGIAARIDAVPDLARISDVHRGAMSLSDTQIIEILILLGFGDKTRTQKQVCEIFNTEYPDRRISQSTFSRTENKFGEIGNVTDIPKSGMKRLLDDEQKLDILLDVQDNSHKPTTQKNFSNASIIVKKQRAPSLNIRFKLFFCSVSCSVLYLAEVPELRQSWMFNDEASWNKMKDLIKLGRNQLR
ncbi:hypothetical protein NQ318_014880 [Aromia moschata]|uniref:Uncharacterized protein n=1 Tax=Aromia moschata TaxID=1265417 RepID=A0AAV8YVI2_9CUCU|nr:hypothetical protein NQ318_014880 [Aromia moschata]